MRSAVNRVLTSVVREIRTLRSVGAGSRSRDPGDPVDGSSPWTKSRPYRDHFIAKSVMIFHDADAKPSGILYCRRDLMKPLSSDVDTTPSIISLEKVCHSPPIGHGKSGPSVMSPRKDRSRQAVFAYSPLI